MSNARVKVSFPSSPTFQKSLTRCSLFAFEVEASFPPPLASAASRGLSLARMWAAEALRGQSPREKGKSRSLHALAHAREILLQEKVC